ncbi:helix-turn-helix domain-containing protein [Streptomyces sp. NPDC056341]|uniref:helix-turn-helix domain-containing protein n=1 Tax=Streptomyces sp. NPDC056341 TaxID=3345788 RepID=UPI0035DFB476
MEDRHRRPAPLHQGRAVNTAELVYGWRKAHGLTQAQLAPLAGTGQAAISRIEQGTECRLRSFWTTRRPRSNTACTTRSPKVTPCQTTAHQRRQWTLRDYRQRRI